MEQGKTIAQFRAEWTEIRRRYLDRFAQNKNSGGGNPGLAPVVLGLTARRQFLPKPQVAPVA